jgi:AcrR family transcriptional regulator
MRADAKRNYSHVLDVARNVITEQGANASLRDIARKAEVGLATLCRHFPTRDALVEALLRTDLDGLTDRATELEQSPPSVEALVGWFKDGVEFFRRYRGVADLMAAADANPGSALHKSCAAVHVAGASLLTRAQGAQLANPDIDGADLFALIAAAGWISDQTSFSARSDHLVDVIAHRTLLAAMPAVAEPERDMA